MYEGGIMSIEYRNETKIDSECLNRKIILESLRATEEKIFYYKKQLRMMELVRYSLVSLIENFGE